MTDTRELTVGSLCTGYGGLDLAVHKVFGARTIWTAENDPAAAKVTNARFPDAPNLGDIKLIDWQQVQRPDIITAGYPCQPFSHAGRRRGTQDPRHIWPWIAEGVRRLRPRYVVLENVAGHLTKGFGEVLGTLAAMGYDATWGCVRASDAGGCHRRARLFVVATDAHGTGPQGRRRSVEGPREQPATASRVEPLLPTPAAADGERRSLTYCRGNPTLIGAVKLLPTPTVVQGRNATAGRTNADSEHHDGWTLNDITFAGRVSATEWGDYAAAIARWEPIIGRPAPSPIDGKGRLSPAFVQWMMGLPFGWVTRVPGLSRTQQLKILGNGVVPQQAELALHLLLERVERV